MPKNEQFNIELASCFFAVLYQFPVIKIVKAISAHAFGLLYKALPHASESIIAERCCGCRSYSLRRNDLLGSFILKAINTEQLIGRRMNIMAASPRGTHVESTFRIRLARGEADLPHSLISTVAKRLSPTLWPLRPSDRTLTEFALEVSEEENRVLKKMVVRLSEIILEFVVSKK